MHPFTSQSLFQYFFFIFLFITFYTFIKSQMINIIARDLFTISKTTNPLKKFSTGFDIRLSHTISAAFAYKNPALTMVAHHKGIII